MNIGNRSDVPRFVLHLRTDEAPIYYGSFSVAVPVPRVGEDVFVGGDAMGWWAVRAVEWMTPSFGAMVPTMEAVLKVEWSGRSNRPAPRWDTALGWVRDE